MFDASPRARRSKIPKIQEAEVVPLREDNNGERSPHHPSKCLGHEALAVRDAEGRFKEIQRYKRAHSTDIKRKATAEH